MAEDDDIVVAAAYWYLFENIENVEIKRRRRRTQAT